MPIAPVLKCSNGNETLQQKFADDEELQWTENFKVGYRLLFNDGYYYTINRIWSETDIHADTSEWFLSVAEFPGTKFKVTEHDFGYVK